MASELNFQKIHDAHRPALVRFLRRMVGEADAEDLAQVVFERANRTLPDFRGEASVGTWLYRIAANAAIDLLRSPSFRRRTTPLDTAGDPTGTVLGEGSASCEGQSIRNEMNACIREVIARLPANYRAVLVLADIEGFTCSEAAERLGLSLEAARIRLHRARGRLKKMLARECRFYRNDLGHLACDRKQANDP